MTFTIVYQYQCVITYPVERHRSLPQTVGKRYGFSRINSHRI